MSVQGQSAKVLYCWEISGHRKTGLLSLQVHFTTSERSEVTKLPISLPKPWSSLQHTRTTDKKLHSVYKSIKIYKVWKNTEIWYSWEAKTVSATSRQLRSSLSSAQVQPNNCSTKRLTCCLWAWMGWQIATWRSQITQSPKLCPVDPCRTCLVPSHSCFALIGDTFGQPAFWSEKDPLKRRSLAACNNMTPVQSELFNQFNQSKIQKVFSHGRLRI